MCPCFYVDPFNCTVQVSNCLRSNCDNFFQAITGSFTIFLASPYLVKVYKICCLFSFHLRSLIHFWYPIISFTAECAKKATLGCYVTTTYNPVACYVCNHHQCKENHSHITDCLFLSLSDGKSIRPKLTAIRLPPFHRPTVVQD